MIEDQVQEAQKGTSPQAVFRQMTQDINRHDLEAMVSCFAPDYVSEQPFHPERNFTGPEGVRKNWSYFFATVPDLRADILSEAAIGDTLLAEIHFHGTQAGGDEWSTRGVIVSGMREGRTAWARLYIEQVPAGELGSGPGGRG